MADTDNLSNIHDSVKDYYGKRLKSADDLQTQACVAVGKTVSKPVREAISAVHDDVVSKYYGCGLVIPSKLEGMNVLDLGSGSGRDCFALSKLVGESGHVTGIDMTDEQIEISRKFIDYHTQKFGYKKPNIEYLQGYIEKLTEAGLKENFYDIIVSNCVVNLSPDKKAVLMEAYKVLKVGGELYFSDVYADRNLPESVRKHEILWGECISGALCWKDLFSLASEIGFSKPYLVTAAPIDIERDDFKQILGDAKFVSVTYRLFKLPKDEKEEATQAIYNGEIIGYEKEFVFDHENVLKAGDVSCISGDVALALKQSRFADEFDFQPMSKKSCGTDPCCDSVAEEDPFVYLENKRKKGEKIASSCCNTSKACC